MRPTKWILVAVTVGAVEAGLLAVVVTMAVPAYRGCEGRAWIELLPQPVTWEQGWAKLADGLTKQEVVELLGPPAEVRWRRGVCEQVYVYPDYSAGTGTQALCFREAEGLQHSGIRFDLRAMSDGESDCLLAVAPGVFVGVLLVTRYLRRHSIRRTGVGHLGAGSRRTSG